MVIDQEKRVRLQLKQLAIFAFAVAEFLFQLLSFANVIHHGADQGFSLVSLRQVCFTPYPALCPVRVHQTQFAHLRFSCFKKQFAMQIIFSMIFGAYEPAQRLPEQDPPIQPNQSRKGKIGFQNQPFSAYREVADRRQVIQVEIPSLGICERGLRPS